MSDVLRYVLYVSSVVVITEVLYNIRKYLRKRSGKEEEECGPAVDTSVVSTALFFPDYSLCCPFVYREDYHSNPLSDTAPERKCNKPLCRFRHFSTDRKRKSPLKKMTKWMRSATESLDVCLWVFTVRVLADICIDLHRKGVSVRVVLDSREDETQGIQTPALLAAGIAVRYAPQMVNSAMFHHKFAIVDRSLLMTGSMNWTLSGFRKNYENICVTSQPSLVSPYVQRFDSYWQHFSSVPTNTRRLPRFPLE